MDVLLEYTKQLGAILELSRDPEGKVNPTKLTKAKKIEALQVMCKSFTYILNDNLIENLFLQVRELCKELDNPNVQAEAASMLELFDKFLAYEEQMFDIRNIPSFLVRDAFGSIQDIKDTLKSFVGDAEFRNQWTKTDGFQEKLSRICESVCKPANDESLDQLLENRFILVGVAAAVINTAADMATGLLVVFNIISTGAGVIVAWRRVNW